MKRSQLKPENLYFLSGGTPVSWIWAFLGVPSDGENRVSLKKTATLPLKKKGSIGVQSVEIAVNLLSSELVT